ncbi:MAG: IPT/TIG domain-containing protein [Holophagales bacterium]|nr:IPT/TIG domain-containing protein [Holophagales bacterium]
MRRLLPRLGLGFTLVLALPAAADGPFRPVATPAEVASLNPTTVRAKALRPAFFDSRLFAEAVRGIAVERPNEVGTPSTLLELPHPDGGLALFRVIASPVMAPELAAKFPEIRTFRGEGVDDPTASVRFDVSPRGFSAMVLSAFGAWYVDPWSRDKPGVVASYHRRDALRDPENVFRCEGPPKEEGLEEPALRSVRSEPGPAYLPLLSTGPTLKTYRLALATTGEYSVAVCGASPTTGCVAAEVATSVNRVSGIYEREMAIRMTLVGNNDLVLYLNGTTDPYTNTSASTLLTQNQSNLDLVIGTASYDIGHVYSTGGGGLAGLGVVCRSTSKARGETGLSNPVGDAFYVDYVAHEMGHQFGGNHTFNGNLGSCAGGNRAASAAYEPGSGSTIMAYAGICGGQDLQSNSDPYFHAKSFDEIVTYTTSGAGAGCAAGSATSNTAPTVEAGPTYTIPAQTPFALTGSATDTEGDPLTYMWEEFDLGTVESGTPLVDAGNRPIFRSFNASTSPTRTFPRLLGVLAGTPCPDLIAGDMCGEVLPTTSRTMNFRLTARDNRAGGGVNSDSTTVTSVSTAGPFAVTAPSTAVSWVGGSAQTVTWNVAATTASPISCASVALTFSTDGGSTFPTTILASTPNDGTQAISVPNLPTTTARIKVACVGNVFFAISRPGFTVTAATGPVVSTISPGTGTTAGGTSVTIAGSGFVALATVTIGGTAATSVNVDSATSITAVTSAHVAGVVDVVVTNPGGESGTLPAGYTYVAGATTGVSFYTVTPCRVVDTRDPDGPFGGPILAASPAERTFTLVSTCGVPADAKALSANVTVTGGAADGSLRFFPSDATLPIATTISFGAGKTRANNTLLLLSGAGGAGRSTVVNDSTAPIHLILDVNGYFK